MRWDRRRGLVNRLFGMTQGDLEVGLAARVLGAEPGIMFDVGAHWGLCLAPFLQRGWTVYAFEPDPSNRAKLEADYPNAIIDPRAVSDSDGEAVTLFTSDVSTGISTLSPFHATHIAGTEVQTVRLDTFIREHDIGNVDFLKTDIEGFDLFALRAFPWDTHHPRAVVCEFEDNKTSRLGYTVRDMASFLEEKGYAVVVSEWYPVVRYGSQHKWRRFSRYPTDVPGDSWGNLIAVDPRLIGELERFCALATRQEHARGRAERILGLK